MNLIEIASNLFIEKMGSNSDNLSSGSVQQALQKLLPVANGDLDIQALVSQFMGQGGGLASLASSWLGNDANQAFSADQLLSLLGESKVSEFADSIGVNPQQAASGLSDMLPDLIDQSSEGGSINSDMVGSLVSGLAGKLFK